MARLSAEPPYAFRRRLESPHATDQRDPDAQAMPGEIEIDASWVIAYADDASDFVERIARDLQEYFLVSMGLSLRIARSAETGAESGAAIMLVLGEAAPEPDRSYRIAVAQDRVVITGRDERGLAQGSYRLEDRLNLRGGPCLTPGDEARSPRFSPRMVHSGWGLDEFPDGHLNQMAHAGIDAILVFAAGVDRSPDEYTHRQPWRQSPGRVNDFSELARRAGRYGIDLYFYAYPHGTQPPHPADAGAERYYEQMYGALFAACPEAKGIILVGESVEFPSRDPNTNGRLRLDPVPDGPPDPRPLPGWWPCTDYPEWVSLVARVCRAHKPDADIVFWTYNWGYAPEADRLALVRALPTDITLQATFEMFEPVERDGYTSVCVDYTMSSVGPGAYFASEAAVAHERGLRLYTMANTGGLTWDFGVIPYQPVPQRWARRQGALRQASDAWGLSGVMESHHFGWSPSIVSELAKTQAFDPAPDPAAVIREIARRDFGDGAASAVAAWDAWSEAMADYVPTNEDQYGPFRIGPAYPLTFLGVPSLPVSDTAMFGELIARVPYQPELNPRMPKSAVAVRVPREIVTLERMRVRWDEGIAELERAAASAPRHKDDRNQRMLNLGRYISHAVETTINVKRWWLLVTRLQVEADLDRANALLDELAAVGSAEIANAEAAIPIVEADSRLGWEPTMAYLGDAATIRWKIDHLRLVLDQEIPDYRASLAR